MANARIGYVNKADIAALSVSSQNLLAPIARLQDPHIGVQWQGTINAEWFVADLGSVQAIDCVRLMGLTAATARIRYSTADPGTGDVFDTGVLPIDQALLTLTNLRSVSARYVRVDLAGDAVCAAGRLFIGQLETFGVNYSWGWTRKRVDPSDRKKTEGGQTRINRRQKYRVFAVSFEFLSDAEANGFTDDIDRINGLTDDVLFIPVPDSANLEQDSIWGLMTDLAPVSQQFIDRWTKPLTIEQRL
ncbi:hypothetical protein SAMN05216374_0966 [Tardiphaga sp. OK246]|uniref:hypothetical protein n=1 Tax=Tardiphaga sp. OK246 TaxID=1855307 RepID=UPI000B759675|nr:hypothetical protein [Tardiphaga sp. OK246]SNS35916.1 hypothetical protein SAMN05216374_0966 [Tardiphaga sp. OK246]